MEFFVYILYSECADKYYVGSTDNWKNRVESHNHSDRNTFTSKHRPWKLMAVFIAGETRAAAMKHEAFIKKQKSRRLIEKLIDGNFVPSGKLTQLVRVPHLRD
jgi:putative endonuclease